MGDINPLKRVLDEETPQPPIDKEPVKSEYDLVKDFHQKFNLLSREDSLIRSRDLSRFGVDSHQELLLFRIGFMLEELAEYCFSVASQNREEALDALVDLDYVLKGTAVLHRFDRYSEAFKRVHDVNMKKERAEKTGDNSKRGSGFDVVKPKGWKPADLKDLL